MKKKLIVLLLVMAMILVSACGKTEKPSDEEKQPEGSTQEEAGEKESEDEASGEMEEPDDVYYTPESGMTIPASKTYNENKDKVFLYYGGGLADEELYYMEYYLYPATYDELDKMSDADFAAAEEQAVNVLNIFRVLDKDWPKEDLEKWCNWMIELEEGSLQELRKDGDYTIYYSLNSEYSDKLSDDLKPIYDGIIADLNEAKDHLELSKPETIDDLIQGMVLDFETTDTEGNKVSSKDIFSKNKYTMVNIWASWCGPCIGEIPELEELNKKFEEKGCGIIGLLTDGEDEQGLADAKEILAEAGVTYLNIIDSMGLSDELQVQAVPTTIFVDSNGQIVGESVIGAMIDKYEEVMNELLGE